MKKRLPRVAILIALPLIFFSVASAALFSTVFGLIVTSSADEAIAVEPSESLFGASPPEGVVLGETAVPQEARLFILREFLKSYHSPLVAYAELILKTSEKYGLDWRLITAISGNESLFGQRTPARTYLNSKDPSDPECYNAWGWGVHSRGTLCFDSWQEGIEEVSKGIKENYIDQGLKTVDEIMLKYAPVSVANGTGWNKAIEYFMNQLERAQNYRQ